MMVYDTDFSSGIYTGGQNYNDNFIDKAMTFKDVYKRIEQPPIMIFRSLMENEDFKQMFILSLCDMRNISFEKGKVDAAHKAMSDVYSPLVKDTYSRFGPAYAKDGFDFNVELFRTFLDGRYDVFIDHIKKSFDTGDAVSVTVKTTDDAKGGVIVDTTTLDLDGKDFSGKYFPAYPITLTADPKAGKFVKWEADGCTVSAADSPVTTVTFDKDCTITAVYE